MTYTPSYKNTSPYARTPIYGRYMGYFVYRPIPANNSDLLFTIASGRHVERPDNLAFDLYGDDNYWWVFGVRNGFLDPIFDIQMGLTLIVPNPIYLKQLLGT